MKDLDKKFENLPKEKFVFANENKNIHDKELVTKPISYFRDAWNRFKRNKGSIFAAIVILILVGYAIIVPMVSQYTVSYNDIYYKATRPKIELFSDLGWDFLDGCEDKDGMNEQTFFYYYSMGVETGHPALKNQEFKKKQSEEVVNGEITFANTYDVRLDYYHKAGVVYKEVQFSEYKQIQEYQDKYNIQIIYPTTKNAIDSNYAKENLAIQDHGDANFWFETEIIATKTVAKVYYNEDGTFYFKNVYADYTGTDFYTSKMRVEDMSEGPKYDYARKINNDSSFQIRVNYYEYYKFYHKEVLKDGIDEPSFIFGTNRTGQDLFTCLASGARFSFVFAIVVAVINLVVGAIYGAIEGYYGGKIDLIMERIVEILSAIPFMIVITLLKYHMAKSGQVLILFIAFFLTGWIGMAGRTRMQFYRFKNQEYVLAARTLGAKDLRIMFKHIFPNSLGTLITGCVLIIPGMIFSETSLSYLGIINLNTGDRTSVGTLLANGQTALVEDPHIVLFPALFISLLMLSFNLFGNGLRDAFNPSLRGSED